MSIELKCEHCGKTIKAPRDLAGKRADCPACKNSLYIPTPEEEIEELPLVPEDEQLRRHEEALQEERCRLDSQLAHETEAGDSAGTGDPRKAGGRAHQHPTGAQRPAGPGNQPAGSSSADSRSFGGTRIEQAILQYLVAMRESNFDAAERALDTIKLQPRVASDLVDRLIADQIPPNEMSDVPPGVYQGFLKNLRNKL